MHEPGCNPDVVSEAVAVVRRAPYTRCVEFRERLWGTIAAVRPILEEPGVLVVGSEVPNLLEPDAASTLVVSQDLDIGIPIEAHAAVKARLDDVREFQPSPEEPSVWLPRSPSLLEVNFVGIDRRQDPTEAYVLADDRLPLLVFGALSLLTPGTELQLAGTRLRLPRVAGLLLEKLVTDRTGDKGERDLLVALGLLVVATAEDLDELNGLYAALRADLRHVVRANLTQLSLLGPRTGMPDPRSGRQAVAALLTRLGPEGRP